MAQQTAIDWLENELHNFIHPEHGKDFLPILEQAKAMEKEQIIKAHKLGFYYNLPDPIVEKNSEKYYNETYNQ